MKALAPYFEKRDFTITSEPQRRQAERRQGAVVRDPEARRHPPALRLPPRARRHAEELGGAQGPEPRPGRQADGGARRGPPDRLRRLRGHDPRRASTAPARSSSGTAAPGSRWATRAPATAPASSSSACTARSCTGGWTLVRMHGHANERQEPWLLIKERDDEARPAAEYSVVEAEPASVLSGRTIEDRPTKAKAGDEGARSSADGAKAGAAAEAPRQAGQAAAGKAKPAAAQAPPACPPARRRRRCPRRCRRSSPRSSPSRRPAAAGSTRSSSTATACWRASTATTCASSPATATTGASACRRWSRRCARSASARPGSTARSSSPAATARPTSTPCRTPSTASRTGVDPLLPVRPALLRRPRPAQRAAGRAPRRPRRRCSSRARRPSASASARTSTPAAAELLQNACRMRLEGMIGKRADSPYVSKRSPTWIKLKCTHRQEFVVGGWTDPKGSRTGIGSLLLGIHDETGKLRFAGGVGSGFDQSLARGAAQGARRPRQRDDAVLREAARRQGPLGPARAGRRGLVRRVDARRPDPPLGLPRPARRQAGAQHHARAAGGGGRGDERRRRRTTAREGATKTAAAKATAAKPAAAKRSRGEEGERRRRGRGHPHQPSRAGDRQVDRHHQARRRQPLPRGLEADPAAPRQAAGVAGARAGRHRRPAVLPEACRHGEDPRPAAARPGDLARPQADGRDRLVHRADRRGAGQRDRAAHLERDDARHDPARPDRLRPRPGRGRELEADPGRHRADAGAARGARPRLASSRPAAARACT